MGNSNTRIIEVASLVPVTCSYPYSRSTVYKNISNFIVTAWILVQILWKNLLIFMFLLYHFIFSLLGISNVFLGACEVEASSVALFLL